MECNSDTLQVSVHQCYCMTYNRQLNRTVVGHCIAMCTSMIDQIYANDSRSLNNEVCGQFKRDGQLCGDCIEGYGPPVYSYTFQCVEWDRSNFKYNLLKYIAVAFIPLTGFYLIVIVLKVRATASYMVAYVLTCQLLSASYQAYTHFLKLS